MLQAYLHAMLRKSQPVVELERRPLDFMVDTLSWLVITGTWIYALASYKKLPDEIPVHFNFKGKPDSYGSKDSIWLIPIISTALVLLLTLINERPHWFNYPVKITPENAESKYRLATSLMRWLKLMMAIIFAFIVWQTIAVAKQHAPDLGIWFLPVSLLVMFGIIGYYLVKTFRGG